MISSLSSLVDRNFVIGFLLPVTVAAIALLFLFQDVPLLGQWWSAALNTAKFTTLTLLVLAIWGLSVLLSVFNISLYKILEGYYGPLAREGSRESARKAREAAQEELKTLRQNAQEGGPDSDAWRDFISSRREFNNTFPPNHLVLPTRFGNIIRAFETYPLRVYNVDGISAWLRLESVIPVRYADTIASARAQVDFFVSLLFLALGLCVLCAGSLLISQFVSGWEWTAGILRRAVAIPVLLLLAFFCYEAAIHRARAWGDYVRSAFDLYLPTLAKQLGYDLPATKEKRQAFWGAVNGMFLDDQPMSPEVWLAETPPGAASGSGTPQA